MDPVNKWLWTIIAFMIALIAVISYKAGAGRYEMAVLPSAILENHDIIYVLDTKSGTVKSRAWNHEKFKLKTGQVSEKWKGIRSRNKREWDYRYGKYNDPVD